MDDVILVLFVFLDEDEYIDRERFRAYFVKLCACIENPRLASLLDRCDGGCDRHDDTRANMEQLFDLLEVGRDRGWVSGGDKDGPKVLVPVGSIVRRVVTMTGIAEPRCDVVDRMHSLHI
jgi:hypothetical protein